MKCDKDGRRCYIRYGVPKKFDENGGQIKEPVSCRFFDAFDNPSCFIKRFTLVRKTRNHDNGE